MGSHRPLQDHGDVDEPPRKRIRKGTKSCWECKRRKVRCQLSSDNVTPCSGCLQRGTTCLSQEYPEGDDVSGNVNLGERLGRVESLLGRIMTKMEQYEEEEDAAKIETPESMGSADLTPATNLFETTPILSLFDNELMAIQISDNAQPLLSISRSTGAKTPSCRPASKVDRLRSVLSGLLPTQDDINIICNESSSWSPLRNLGQYIIPDFNPLEDGKLPRTFDVNHISTLPPTAIGKMILYIAICLQQLPPHFDTSRLRLPSSIHLRIDKYISTVTALITADDELVSSIEGLECLLLLGVFHINAGNPRRAWFAFRRALNVGQLIGLHRFNAAKSGKRNIWFQLVQADRYLALLLGLPAGSSQNVFLPHETFLNPDMDKDILFSRKLSEISTHVIDRNQADNIHAYATTQGIDEQMENLAKEMPPEWWLMPTLSDQQTTEACKSMDRIMIQIWFFQLDSLIHLPFMLRAGTERRYDYNRFCCLKASREVLHRYLALRKATSTSFCCKVIDFGALTATVTLSIGLIDSASPNESGETMQQRKSDRILVQTVLVSMEELASSHGDVIAAQSVGVIKSLSAADILSGSDATSGFNISNLRLSIPYFGIINIIRKPQTSSVSEPSNEPSSSPQTQQQHPQQQISQKNLPWQDFQPSVNNAMAPPVVSFTSSQFQPMVPELTSDDWDTLYFDSLLGSDIENTNWTF